MKLGLSKAKKYIKRFSIMKRPEKSIINPVNNYYRCVKLIIPNAQ